MINDANGNGRVDVGEQPLVGVTVMLTGGAARQVSTDQNGAFSFTNLVPGTYTVTEINLPGFLDSGVIAGTGGAAALDNNNIRVTLVAGQESRDNIFLDTMPPREQCVPACFSSADMWLLDDRARRAAIDAAGGAGNIFLLTLKRGAASEDEILTALDALGSDLDLLNREFVTAQLNAFAFPGSNFNRASCFYLGPNVILRIPGDPRLIDVLNEARTAFTSGDPGAIRQVTANLANFNNITATRGIVCKFADP